MATSDERQKLEDAIDLELNRLEASSEFDVYSDISKASPYVRSGDRGKYVADGQYARNTVDQRLDIISLVVAMMESDQ